jgi:uncharacterized protein
MNTTESLLTFPCDYHLKVMGKRGDEFEMAVLQIVRKHVPTLGEAAVQRRDSAQNNYCSLSIQFTADSRAQLDAMYLELRHCPLVLMAL